MVTFTIGTPVDYPAGTISLINDLVGLPWTATDGVNTYNGMFHINKKIYPENPLEDLRAEMQLAWDEYMAHLYPPDEEVVDG